jgi:hypothetical protein
MTRLPRRAQLAGTQSQQRNGKYKKSSKRNHISRVQREPTAEPTVTRRLLSTSAFPAYDLLATCERCLRAQIPVTGSFNHDCCDSEFKQHNCWLPDSSREIQRPRVLRLNAKFNRSDVQPLRLAPTNPRPADAPTQLNMSSSTFCRSPILRNFAQRLLRRCLVNALTLSLASHAYKHNFESLAKAYDHKSNFTFASSFAAYSV